MGWASMTVWRARFVAGLATTGAALVLVAGTAVAQPRAVAPSPPPGPVLARQEPPPPPPPPSFPEPPSSTTTLPPTTTTTRPRVVATRKAATTLPPTTVATVPPTPPPTIATTTTSSTIPPVTRVKVVTRDRIPVWIWVLLALSGAANLAVLGAFLNNRYRSID